MLFFLRKFLTNLVALLLPSIYVRWKKETGREAALVGTTEIRDYFLGCFFDYFRQLEVRDDEIPGFLAGKSVLEYGPGDMLGVAVLMYAYGAEYVHCVDRFRHLSFSAKNLEVYRQLLQSMPERMRERACGAFRSPGRPESGFDASKVAYSVVPSGLGEVREEYDLVLSRSVLEHVNNLEKIFENSCRALRKGGVSVHKVDLRSHDLDERHELDFLAIPSLRYALMYGCKGFPNRHRVNVYRELIARSGLHCRKLEAAAKVEPEKARLIQPLLAKEFREVELDDLTWLDFWMILEKP